MLIQDSGDNKAKLSKALATTANQEAAKCVSLIDGFKSKITFKTRVNFSTSITSVIDWNNPSKAPNADETKNWSDVFEISNKMSHNSSILLTGHEFVEVIILINCKTWIIWEFTSLFFFWVLYVFNKVDNWVKAASAAKGAATCVGDGEAGGFDNILLTASWALFLTFGLGSKEVSNNAKNALLGETWPLEFHDEPSCAKSKLSNAPMVDLTNAASAFSNVKGWANFANIWLNLDFNNGFGVNGNTRSKKYAVVAAKLLSRIWSFEIHWSNNDKNDTK